MQAEPITVDQEEQLWQQGILGIEIPQQIVDTLLYILGVQFGLQAKDEHKSLLMGLQLSVKTDSENGKYFLEYYEYSSKNHQGGLNNLCCKQKVCHAYYNANNHECCIVTLYEKYVSMRQ